MVKINGFLINTNNINYIYADYSSDIYGGYRGHIEIAFVNGETLKFETVYKETYQEWLKLLGGNENE